MTTGYRERPDRDGCRDRGDRDDRRDRGDPREGREGEGPVGVGPPRDRDTLRTPIKGLLIGRVFSLIFLTFLGDFTPDRLDSRSLYTLWEWKNRVLLEEYHIFNVVIPLEVE